VLSSEIVTTMVRTDRLKTQPFQRGVFIRVETAGGRAVLAGGSCAELATTIILNFRQQAAYALIGFVVLPKEIQMIIVPREVSVGSLGRHFEQACGAILCQLAGVEPPAFDTEIYMEPLDGSESLKSRMQGMLQTPVRLRLSGSPAAYDYSSANVRFQNELDKLER